jgi:hypothetical protein
MKAAIAVFGTLLAAVVVLTLMTGGRFNLGTSPGGPSFSIGYVGAQGKNA